MEIQSPEEDLTYDQTADFYARYIENSKYYDPVSKAQTLRAIVPQNSRILDIGCGTGGIGIELLRAGFVVYGLDSSDEMLKIFKQRATEHNLTQAEFYMMNAKDFIPEQNQYNVIFSNGGAFFIQEDLERVITTLASLELINTTLKNLFHGLTVDGGYLIFNQNHHSNLKNFDFGTGVLMDVTITQKLPQEQLVQQEKIYTFRGQGFKTFKVKNHFLSLPTSFFTELVSEAAKQNNFMKVEQSRSENLYIYELR